MMIIMKSNQKNPEKKKFWQPPKMEKINSLKIHSDVLNSGNDGIVGYS
jgi:hypothetical protein